MKLVDRQRLIRNSFVLENNWGLGETANSWNNTIPRCIIFGEKKDVPFYM